MDNAEKPTLRTFPVWKTVKIGRFDVKGPLPYYKAMEKSECDICDDFADVLAKTTFATEEKSVQLVRITQEDLGLDASAPYHKFNNVAVKSGLIRPNAEIASALRLDYQEQGDEDCLFGTVPVDRYAKEGAIGRFILRLSYSRGKLSVGMSYCPWDCAHPFHRFVFVQPSEATTK